MFPGTEWRGAPAGPSGRPRLYLTFDDGPIPEETPWVLEQLAAFRAPATFFCVGDNLVRYPEIARAALAAGHYPVERVHSPRPQADAPARARKD